MRHAGATSLRLVDARAVRADAPEWVAFCSRCAHSVNDAGSPVPRVCTSCGMGLMLNAPHDVVPSPGAAFLVADAALAVGAVSPVAEELLGIDEGDAVHRPLTELLAPADAEAAGVDLAAAVGWAAAGDPTSRVAFVRPTNTFGVRCRARIGPCGPPSAAVVVLE